MLNTTTGLQRVANQRGSLRWCWLAVVVIVLDQLSKYLVSHWLTLYQPVALTPFFNLTLIHNTGAAYGFLSQTKVAIYLFSLVALIASIIIINWLRKTPANQPIQALSLALILGGALGNLIDRVVYGYVIDFFDFYLGNWHFAAFNVADAAISIGAGLLLLNMFIWKK